MRIYRLAGVASVMLFLSAAMQAKAQPDPAEVPEEEPEAPAAPSDEPPPDESAEPGNGASDPEPDPPESVEATKNPTTDQNPTTDRPAIAKPAPKSAPSTPRGVKPKSEPDDRKTKNDTKKEEPPRLLAPIFPEDRYPGDSREGKTDFRLQPDRDDGFMFGIHGYFRAPMRFSRVKRDAGSTTDREGNYDIRTPLLVDDNYFDSGFLYTPVNESDWNELYLSVGNERLTATVGFMNSIFSDAAQATIDKQLGLAQGWLTYRYTPEIPFFKMRIRVKGGAFWDRFGYLPKYDTYLFGRTHQMGGQLRVELERDDFVVWVLDGLGTHLDNIPSNQGLTLLHYLNGGVSYARTVELAGYYLDSTARDKRQLKQLTDANMRVVGADVRVDTHLVGRGLVGISFVDADHARFLSPAIELMHSTGGFGIAQNYLGTENSNDGTGSLRNIGFQYDFSLAELLKGLSARKTSPLPWGGDVLISIFGLLTHVKSDQADPSRRLNRDDITKWKWGGELGWRATEWIGASVRYDRVVPNIDDSASSFRILSPRLSLFTHFLTHEEIFFQFSRYWYKERVALRGDELLETDPDQKIFKLQAQITF